MPTKIIKRVFLFVNYWLIVMHFGQSVFANQHSYAPSLPTSISVAVGESQDKSTKTAITTFTSKLANALNVKPKIIECPWARCLKLIEKGHADIILSVFNTPNRETYMLFLKPELFTHHLMTEFYHLKGRKITLNAYADLSALSIAVPRGNKYFPQFDNDNGLEKVELVNYETAVQLILTNRADVLIDLSLTSAHKRDRIDKHGLLVRAAYSHLQFKSEFLGVSKASKWAKHEALMSKTLSILANRGDVKQYIRDYINASPTKEKHKGN